MKMFEVRKMKYAKTTERYRLSIVWIAHKEVPSLSIAKVMTNKPVQLIAFIFDLLPRDVARDVVNYRKAKE